MGEESRLGKTVPLAPSQEAIWDFIRYFSPRNPAEERFSTFDFRLVDGPVHLPTLREAVADVAQRHDSLRIVFTDLGGDPHLRFDDSVRTDVSFVDVSGLPAEAQRKEAGRLAWETLDRVFDLLEGPLWTLCVVRISERRHLLIVSFFHLVADGWSLGIFFRDLMTAYRARRGEIPAPKPLKATFQEVIERQRAAQDAAVQDVPDAAVQDLAAQHAAAQSASGQGIAREPLGPVQPGIVFPIREHPGTDLRAEAEHPFSFEPHLAAEVHRLAWEIRTTPLVLLLACYQICLRQRTGVDGIRIGTVTFGRNTAESAQMVGQFTTNVYLPPLSGPGISLRQAIVDTHTELKLAVSRERSFKSVAREVHPGFEQERPWPFLHLFHSWFQEVPETGQNVELGDITVSRPPLTLPPVPEATRTTEPAGGSLGLWIKRGAPSMIVNGRRDGGKMTYNPSFFDPQMIADFAHDYQRVVRYTVEHPDRRVDSVVIPRVNPPADGDLPFGDAPAGAPHGRPPGP